MALGLALRAADTTVRIEGKLYRLYLSATTDSSHMLQARTTGIVGEVYAVDSNFVRSRLVKGPKGQYTIVLRDAAGQLVFKREFHKVDFYSLVGADIAVVAEPERPLFLGYYPALGGLAFYQSVSIPQSDVGVNLFLLVDLRGRVLELSRANAVGSGCASCTPRATPDGRALLTCSKLLRAGRPPLVLLRPKAELTLASFVNDSTLLTLYDYAQLHYTYAVDSSVTAMAEVEPAAMRRMPNAFLTTVAGTELAHFRFDGAINTIGYTVPYTYVPAVHTYYLLNAERGVRLIDKQHPATTHEVKFAQMTPFRSSQQPNETHFRVQSEVGSYDFYVNRYHPDQLRYQRLMTE